ncbi:NADH-quinone oxidoreductase subunit N [Aquicella siphonis]|uniref:NADH-quinone oxidoreductase subunit N n=1 Tax=Aquicella siphonis TaxID=254247 RepID=A0A5E4PFE0_9COXI|nr:NADH-quinone oxidoreductase subunit NuoN [Aquicella siphonis]VVC75222.1 NADH-quinone oxidoreductase subunit N [Aquicella siphonis]
MNFFAAMPEIFILSMACLILVVDAFLPERRRNVTYLLVQLTLVAAFVLTVPQFKDYPGPITTFSGNYVVDDLAVTCKLFMYLFSLFAFAYAREYLQARKIPRGEYYLLGLFSVLGMSIMVSAYTFLTIYLGLELLSLSLYAMVAMNKKSSDATEAAMKYFVLGALASGILLYGISLLYGVTGSIQLGAVAGTLQSRDDVVPVVALIFVMAGLIFKFGAVPFHMWVPDVYQGASTPTTLFIASAPKIAAFAITVRILVQAMPSLQNQWELILIVISILSMFLGNLLAIAQVNLKRMLAYSSIAHIGYALLGILAGPNSSQGYSAAMFYISTYVLVAAGAFAIIAIMSREGFEFDKLDDYRGLNARNPWLAFMMLLLLFSMAGVPPTVGFFAKLGLLEALVQAKLVWLAVLALVFALVGAYYYLRVVMLMYFEEPSEGMINMPITVSSDMMIAISINGAAALLLGLLPSFFIDLCRISVG